MTNNLTVGVEVNSIKDIATYSVDNMLGAKVKHE